MRLTSNLFPRMRTVFINLDAREFAVGSRYVIAFVIRPKKWKDTRESVLRRFPSPCLVCSGGHSSKLTSKLCFESIKKCVIDQCQRREKVYYWFIIDYLRWLEEMKVAWIIVPCPRGSVNNHQNHRALCLHCYVHIVKVLSDLIKYYCAEISSNSILSRADSILECFVGAWSVKRKNE